MTIFEPAPRRDGFSEGRWFVGNDGHSWCLPVIDVGSWDRFGKLREYLRLDPIEVMEVFAEFDPDRPLPRAVIVLRELLFEMLLHQYEATATQVVNSLAIRHDDGHRELEYTPMIGFAVYLNEHMPLIVSCDFADRNGYDVKDVIAMNKLDVLDRPIPGFFRHDGVIFEN